MYSKTDSNFHHTHCIINPIIAIKELNPFPKWKKTNEYSRVLKRPNKWRRKSDMSNVYIRGIPNNTYLMEPTEDKKVQPSLDIKRRVHFRVEIFSNSLIPDRTLSIHGIHLNSKL